MSESAHTIGLLANAAAILTAVIAVFGYGAYRVDRCIKRCRLENYLKSETQEVGEGDHGQRSLLHLMAELGMTEAELLQASFRSKHIDRKIAADKSTGRAEALLLEWKD